MKLILSLSTSAERSHVLVARGLIGGGWEALGEASSHPPARAGDVFFALLDEALAASGASRRDLQALCCDVGPGSFTGVRIGVAAARALGFALGVPTYAVSSLRALAEWSAEGRRAPTFAVLDAGRGELHSAAYDGDVELAPPAHLSIEATRARAPAGLRVLGRGLESALPVAPDARLVLSAALPRALAGALGDDLEPLYLRAPDVTLPRSAALPDPRPRAGSDAV